jgi:hypothetical protein
MRKAAFLALLGVALLAGSVQAADLTTSLKQGTPDIKSAGPLAFGPDGVIFAGDPLGAAIFAIDTGDRPSAPAKGHLKTVEGLDQKIGSLLGTDPQLIRIIDMAINPASGNAYLSVARGKGPDAQPVILRVNHDGKIDELSLKSVRFAKAMLPDAPGPDAKDRRGQPQRQVSITDLAYVDGRVFVAGLSNEEWSSTFRSIPFPFSTSDKGTSVGIYHGAHGQFETTSPIRTFAPYKIAGQDHLLAAYTCTPLVKVAVADLKPGARVKGTTVAELGNRNQPLDMVIYQKDGKTYILMANTTRGMMKITTDNIDKTEPITSRIADKAGLTYETIEALKGVEQLDKLNEQHAVVLVRSGSGLTLQTVHLP